MRSSLSVALATAGLLVCNVARAQVGARDSAAVVAGVVRDGVTGRALSYSVVSVEGASVQQFSDEAGRFRLVRLPPGPVVLRVRHLGYAPAERRLSLRSGDEQTLNVELSPIAVNLAAMASRASVRCDSPHAPEAAEDSAFAAVFDQVRENSEQYRLLSTQYPFAAVMARRFDAELHNGTLDTRAKDTVVFRSDHLWPYHPGQVVDRSYDARSPDDYIMHVPTLDVIADSAFIAAHCFSNGGLAEVNGRTALRVDYLAASSIRTPDVSGAVYLDTATFQILRSVARLSRRPTVPDNIDSAEVVTDFGEAYPSVPLITAIRSRDRFSYSRTRATVETQTLVSFAWLRGRPGASVSPPLVDLVSNRPITHRTLLVVDSATARPLAGAEVIDAARDSVSLTDEAGRTRLDFVAESGGEVIVRRIGFGARTLPIPPAGVDDSLLRVALSPVTILPTVGVEGQGTTYRSPALQSFEERRRLGMGGYFIGDSLLRRDESRKLGDVLRSRIPGANISEGFGSANFLQRSPRCTSGGPPQVYLDGVPLAAPPPLDPNGAPSVTGATSGNAANRATSKRGQVAAVPPFDLTQFNVSDLAGVEYYPDGTALPVEFDHSSQRCGALLLWTRER